MVETLEKCRCCDGSGEVHSHNPRCWVCGGLGLTTKEKNEEQKRQEKLMGQIFRETTWDYR